MRSRIPVRVSMCNARSTDENNSKNALPFVSSPICKRAKRGKNRTIPTPSKRPATNIKNGKRRNFHFAKSKNTLKYEKKDFARGGEFIFNDLMIQ